MSTRPDWAMDRAAQVLLIALSPQRPTEQMDQIAALLELTRLEGAADQAVVDARAVDNGITAAFRRHLQAAE